MTADKTTEQRLVALESMVASLQERLARITTGDNWLDKITGSISDDEAFQEALEYGRAYRQADRPEDGTDGEP